MKKGLAVFANPIFFTFLPFYFFTFLPFHAMQLVTPSAVAMADSTLMAV